MEISVIVPVYNVEEYLDQCVQSIADQSFRDFEVIFVDDGSTDTSGKKCIAWTQKDDRFRYFFQENQGLSAARNFGITQARGRYLAFIDSDDWIDYQYLELMFKAAIQENADMAECEVYRYDSNTGRKSYRRTYGCMEREYTKSERIKYGYSQIWKTLTKRELWTRNDVFFPHCFAQSRGVYALLVALSNKVAVARAPLYVYRKFRKDSISERGYITAKKHKEKKGDPNQVEGIFAYKNLLDEFHRCGIYDRYAEILEEMIKFKSGDMLASLFVERAEKEYLPKAKAYQKLIQERFPNAPTISCAVLGGYNLNRIVWHMNLLHNPYLRFNFSSLISIVNPVNEAISFKHKNKYRLIMIDRDVMSSFWNIIEEEKTPVLVLDFIDDRFDVIKINGGYVTKSDALEESSLEYDKSDIVPWGTKEFENIWESSCREFIRKIRESCFIKKIVLVENYLSEYQGDYNKKVLYPNIKEIRKTNKILKKFYDFFTSKCKEADIIKPYDFGLYYTDKEYEYGAIPSHLNDLVNRQIAKEIEKVLGIHSSVI